MRQSLVIGNWKMHGSLLENEQLLGQLLTASRQITRVSIAVCPPFIYLDRVGQQLKASAVALGAQNVCAESLGAFTGEVSASMLADNGVNYVLVGHSERRELYGETDAVVAKKFERVRSEGLIPVLCVGENLSQREAGDTLTVVSQQLKAVIDSVGIQQFDRAVVAYEPIWAIGTGKTASPEQAQEVHAYIRQVLAQYDQPVAEKIQLLYGGSVKADNAASLFEKIDIDGALVGGASLKADDFIAICKAAE